VTPLARTDMAEIIGRLAELNPTAARALARDFEQAFALLAQFPKAGRERPELSGGKRLMFWPADKYMVAYRQEKKQVAILAVLHAARDIPAILGDREEIQ